MEVRANSRVRFRRVALLCCLALGACTTGGSVSERETGPLPTRSNADFDHVSSRVEPAAESFCRERARGGQKLSCDFTFRLAPDRALPANAYQSQDRNGRPVVTMTAALLDQLRDDDEVAMVLSHEAAHHVAGHLGSLATVSTRGTFLPEAMPEGSGVGSKATTRTDYGRGAAARTYSRAIELEADWIGAFISERAGYSPVEGAGHFRRLPSTKHSAGARMSSHPTASQRLETVAAASGKIRRQRAAGQAPAP